MIIASLILTPALLAAQPATPAGTQTPSTYNWNTQKGSSIYPQSSMMGTTTHVWNAGGPPSLAIDDYNSD